MTQENPFSLPEDSRTIGELESELLENGISPDQLRELKEKLFMIHAVDRATQLMVGNSFAIMSTAINYGAECGLDFEGKMTIKTFADKYHVWMAENEAVLIDEAFGKMVKNTLPNLTPEETEILLLKIRHAGSQLNNPEIAKDFYQEIMMDIIEPSVDLLSYEGIHSQLSSYLNRLAEVKDPSTDEPIFRNDLLIIGWIFLEEIVLEAKNNLELKEAMSERECDPGEIAEIEKAKTTLIHLLKAIRRRDLKVMNSIIESPEAQSILDPNAFTEILPTLTEQLD